MTPALHRWAPPLSAALASVAFGLVLFPDLARSLSTGVPAGTFQLPHLWAFDHVGRMVTGERPWAMTTSLVGFPGPVEARFIAWVPMLLSAVMRPLTGEIAAFNIVTLLAAPLAALAAYALTLRVAPAPASPSLRWAAAAFATTFACSPFMVGNLSSGQVCKAQLWIGPVGVYVVAAALLPRAREGWARRIGGEIGALLLVALTSLATALTEPTYALFMPFAVGATVLWAILEGPPGDSPTGKAALLARLGPLLRAPLVLGAWAAAMLPAKDYYGGAATAALTQAFHPATRPITLASVGTYVASWEPTILGRYDWPRDLAETVHVTWLPWALLAVGLPGMLVGGRVGRLGGFVGVAGVVMAMGEVYVRNGQAVMAGGEPISLPMAWVAYWGYPLAKSGMYYRAIFLTTLGLALGAAGLCARIPRGLGAVAAVILAGVAVGSGLRVTQPLWPKPVEAISGRALWEQIAADPDPGAVICAPWVATTNEWRRYLGAAVLHGHPTNALPRALRPQEIPTLATLDRDLRAALASADPPAAVRAMGVRWIAWYPIPNDGGVSAAALQAALGPPRRIDDLAVWDVGPTAPSP